jgi:hypothetical protein
MDYGMNSTGTTYTLPHITPIALQQGEEGFKQVRELLEAYNIEWTEMYHKPSIVNVIPIFCISKDEFDMEFVFHNDNGQLELLKIVVETHNEITIDSDVHGLFEYTISKKEKIEDMLNFIEIILPDVMIHYFPN